LKLRKSNWESCSCWGRKIKERS